MVHSQLRLPQVVLDHLQVQALAAGPGADAWRLHLPLSTSCALVCKDWAELVAQQMWEPQAGALAEVTARLQMHLQCAGTVRSLLRSRCGSHKQVRLQKW